MINVTRNYSRHLDYQFLNKVRHGRSWSSFSQIIASFTRKKPWLGIREPSRIVAPQNQAYLSYLVGSNGSLLKRDGNRSTIDRVSSTYLKQSSFKVSHCQLSTIDHEVPSIKVNTRMGISDAQEPQSRMLKDFLGGRLVGLTLSQLKGRIAEFAQNDRGLEFIEQRLERATTEEKQMVLNEIVHHVPVLMNHEISRLLFLRFLRIGIPFSKLIKNNFYGIAFDKKGCELIIQSLESLPDGQLDDMIFGFRGLVMKYAKHAHSNLVLSKCIEHSNPNHLDFIMEEIEQEVVCP